jgi:hypothetical protein
MSMTETYIEELKIELQRLSPAALEGDEEALARCAEIEAEIGAVEQRERLEVLAARERERLKEERLRVEEEQHLAGVRVKYRELQDDKLRLAEKAQEELTALCDTLANVVRLDGEQRSLIREAGASASAYSSQVDAEVLVFFA